VIAERQSAPTRPIDGIAPPGPPSPDAQCEGPVLAFDFGARRIGVAVGHTEVGIPHPLDVISYEDNHRRLAAIAALIEEWCPARLVLGCPEGAGPQMHALKPAIERFARRLRARFHLRVDLVDEALSSWDASRRLHDAGLPARAHKARIDSMAACVILETWFANTGCRASEQQR
jgi:putative Holliday junction resolvase